MNADFSVIKWSVTRLIAFMIAWGYVAIILAVSDGIRPPYASWKIELTVAAFIVFTLWMIFRSALSSGSNHRNPNRGECCD